MDQDVKQRFENNDILNNMLSNQDSTNIKLFAWVYDLITSEGGDGDVVIGFTHQNYLNVSQLFREWLELNIPLKYTMEIKDTHVIFINHQEYFIFTNKLNFESIQNYGPRILTW